MKPGSLNPKSNPVILEEASNWFVIFRDDDVDSVVRERFDQWLRQSPEHIRAYIEIARTYAEVGSLNLNLKVNIKDLVARARVVDHIVPFNPPSEPKPTMPAGAGFPVPLDVEVTGGIESDYRVPDPVASKARHFLMAASVIVAVAGTVFTASLGIRGSQTLSTPIGERRSITLADGSIVDLNGHSTVRVRFSKNERVVQLIEGQALFEVMKDSARPFFVSTDTASIRAVGTQFDVDRKKSGTTVTVIEGRVAVYSQAKSNLLHQSVDKPSGQSLNVAASNQALVSHVGTAAPPVSTKPKRIDAADRSAGTVGTGPVYLIAGEQIKISSLGMSTRERADIAATMAWTEHRLVFNNTRLEDVIEEFARYNSRKLVVEDEQLKAMHISGVYSSSDPDSLVRFLRAQPGVVIGETDSQVRIMRR